MSPPDLPGNAPVFDAAHPPVPQFVVVFRYDGQFLAFGFLEHDFPDFLTAHVPLRTQQRLDYVFGTRT